VLTQTGRDFLDEARGVVGCAKAAAQVLDHLAGLKRRSLTIATSQTVANYWVPQRIQTFQNGYPGIDLNVRVANTPNKFRTFIKEAQISASSRVRSMMPHPRGRAGDRQDAEVRTRNAHAHFDETQAPRRAIEQPRAEPAFQILDLLGHQCLRHLHLARRPRSRRLRPFR
jgi:hypothetical protein